MNRKIITTSDGSKTIQITDWNEQYHSVHGAIQEANHVFIKSGLLFYCNEILAVQEDLSKPKLDSESNKINILEIGFGTGLNAFLTLINAEKLQKHINYVGVEAYPVALNEIEQLNYVELISEEKAGTFKKLHTSNWEIAETISVNFTLKKEQKFFNVIDDLNKYNIIYFDTFGARVQPELWTEAMFSKMFSALKPNGVLVTYSAKGSVRRAMQAVGFKVERLPGPPGKREMLRASKGK